MKKLKFNEKKHTYTVGKNLLTSVTRFVHKQFPTFQASAISKRIAKFRRKKGEKVTAWDVKREWRAIADRGTLVHKEIEDWIIDSEKSEPLLAVYQDRSLQGIEWMMDNYPTGDVKTEWRVFSEELGLAGTIDVFIKTDDGRNILVDWKTNKKIRKHALGSKEERIGSTEATKDLKNCNFVQYSLQLNTYKHIIEKEYDIDIDEMWIVHLQGDKIKTHKIDDMQDKVKEMLEWHHKNKK